MAGDSATAVPLLTAPSASLPRPKRRAFAVIGRGNAVRDVLIHRRGAPCARATHGVGGGAYGMDGRDNAWRSRAPGPHAHGNAARRVVHGLRTGVCGQQKQFNDPRNDQHNHQYANYWALLAHKRHTLPQPAQPQHTNRWANAEMTPAGAPAAAADRTQRPDATCEGKNG